MKLDEIIDNFIHKTYLVLVDRMNSMPTRNKNHDPSSFAACESNALGPHSTASVVAFPLRHRLHCPCSGPHTVRSSTDGRRNDDSCVVVIADMCLINNSLDEKGHRV